MITIDPHRCTYSLLPTPYFLPPGGYAWIFPKGEHKANVGLGVQADLWQDIAARPPSGDSPVKPLTK